MNELLYLDPGSGSYLVQALVAGALGVVFFFRNILNYIKAFFALLFGKKKNTDPAPGEDPTTKEHSEKSDLTKN
ncbi:MAG: hypothetical protein IPQ08_01415 [Chitinophagaceae bacterium]|nr:hypothetical protein [Chitinophagaceae bacterium]